MVVPKKPTARPFELSVTIPHEACSPSLPCTRAGIFCAIAERRTLAQTGLARISGRNGQSSLRKLFRSRPSAEGRATAKAPAGNRDMTPEAERWRFLPEAGANYSIGREERRSSQQCSKLKEVLQCVFGVCKGFHAPILIGACIDHLLWALAAEECAENQWAIHTPMPKTVFCDPTSPQGSEDISESLK